MRTVIVGFCAIAFMAAGLRAATETDGDRMASIVAPFLEDQTLLVMHLDLMALDAAKTVDWLAELLQLSDAAHQKARADVAPINVVTQALPKDATIDIMVVSSLADLSRMPFMVVLPLDGTVPSRAIAGELSRDLEKQWQRKIVNEEIGKALVIGSQQTIERVKKGRPVERPEVAAALEAAGEGAVRLAFVPSADLRRLVEGLLPETLPQQLGGAPTTAFTQGVMWLAAGIELPPDDVVIRLVVQSADTQSAAALETAIADLFEAVGQVAAIRSEFPQFDEISQRLIPKADGDRLLLELTEENEGIAAMTTLLTPLLRVITAGVPSR